MEFIEVCGLFGFVILSFTFALFVVGVLLLCLAKSRKLMAIFTIVALLPLGLGLCGTMIGYSHVNMVAKTIETETSEVIQLGKEQARCTSYLGIGASGFLLCLGIVGLLTKRNTAQGAKGVTSSHFTLDRRSGAVGGSSLWRGR